MNPVPVIASPSTLRQAQDRLGSGQAKARQSMTSGLHGLPQRFAPRNDGDLAVTASVARQSMQSGVMDCFTAFAMTATFAMTNLNVTASVARQFRTSGLHGLPQRFAPRNDGDLAVTANVARQFRTSGLHGLPQRFAPRNDGGLAVTASVARQSMQSGVMDCFTAFAMTATFAMTNLNVTASVARQSMTSWIASLRSQ